MKKTQMLIAAVALAAVAAWGQGPAATAPTPTPRKSPIALSIWPQALEKPDLHFQLTPRFEDTTEGNAAVKYLAAAAGIVHADNESTIEDKLRYCALQDLDEKAATEFLRQYQGAFKYMRDGARLDSLTWETNIRHEGMNAILPGLSSTRSLATALSIAIRVEIKNHRWTQAQDLLQTGYSIARQMGHGETLIECLVGAAIESTMNNCVEEWVSEPGAPNLYWPLTNAPALIDVRRAITTERSTVFVTFPELKQMRNGPVTREVWIGFINRFFAVSSTLAIGHFEAVATTTKTELAATLYAAAEYPRAKDFLVARGMKREDVEKMPVTDVVGRYFVRSYDEVSDDLYKGFGLPLVQAVAETIKASEEFSKQAPNQMNMLARITLPSLARIQFVSARGDRQIAMLRTVEALRAYAAEKGELPDKLDQLTVPLPLDPFTGKGFDYERHGDQASVIANAPTGSKGDAYRYDLKLHK